MTSAPTPPTDRTELPPTYDPTQVEPHILARYLAEKAYAASPGDAASGGGEPYSIVIPPPNVTAALHLGHALNNTLQDVLTRYHRMRGFNTLWMPGTDHAGIATQTVVDKRLQQEGKPALKEYKQKELAGENGRGQFIEKVAAWKDEYEQTITNQLKEMGCSCDWDRQRFTMDDQCAKAVREAFFQLFKDGLIYRGKRLVNWDPVSQTALADDEVEMQEVDGNFYYMKYPIVKKAADGVGGLDANDSKTKTADDIGGLNPGQWVETGEFATVATTRPETMLGDTAVAVNPNDAPRAKYIGQFVKLPIVNRVIPIIGDDYVVIPDPDSDDGKAKMASGFLKVTPAHDPNDYEIGQRHNLAIINVMAPDASISIDHGWPAEEKPGENKDLKPILGLSREEARKQVVMWFKNHDLMAEVKPYRHAVGHSYRSHVPIEPYYTDQWYVKVTDDRLKGAALRAMSEEQRQPSDDPSFSEGGAGVPPAIGPQGQTTLTVTKRRLPHWELGGSTYFITFRLAGGELSDPERKTVLDACLHWHGQRADIFLCTVMPDHVHLLLQPVKKNEHEWHTLSDLLHSIKSFTAHELNKQRGTKGKVWQDESYDRIVRHQAEFEEKWQYIETNPARAGLVQPGETYAFTASGDSALRADGRRDARPTSSIENNGDGGLTFTPERYAKTFQNWHENIRDWCISRQLWWGHRIPVWSKSSLPISEQVDISGTGQVSSEDIYAACDIKSEYQDRLASQAQVDESKRTITAFICVRDETDVEMVNALEDRGFERDPDVLDTWFSSALWPLSTLGWPDDTAELKTWNPTSVLCTAREIITLWVSRMVMFNRYFKGGDLPFKDVFIHAMIQDGHGQKMSKSLGNGVDPMDIIHSHGADAMRFTLTKMTTQTQDVRLPVDMVDPHTGQTFTPEYITASGGVKVAAPIQERGGKKMVSSYGIASGKAKADDDMPAARNTSEKFDEGQRFANKLWNAFRFALGNLENLDAAPPAEGKLELADRWVLNQLTKTIKDVDAALRTYAFSDYATAVYDFFWRDLCDWYIEIVKRTLKESPTQQRVLATCLDAALRLLHPVMPFITERLWQTLNEQVPASWRGLEGFGLEPNELLIRAAWPVADDALLDASAERDFELLRSIIVKVREARTAYKIPPRQEVEATTKAPAAVAQLLLASRNITQPLTGCKGRGVGPAVDRPAGSAAVLVGEVTVYLHDVIDVETELARLQKLLADNQRQVKTFEGRLSNEKYINNAPAHLVQETREQHAAAIKELDAVQRQIDELSAAG